MSFRYNAFQMGFQHAMNNRVYFNPFSFGTKDFEEYRLGYEQGVLAPITGSM